MNDDVHAEYVPCLSGRERSMSGSLGRYLLRSSCGSTSAGAVEDDAELCFGSSVSGFFGSRVRSMLMR